MPPPGRKRLAKLGFMTELTLLIAYSVALYSDQFGKLLGVDQNLWFSYNDGNVSIHSKLLFS